MAYLQRSHEVRQTKIERRVSIIKDYSIILNTETLSLINKVRLLIKENEILQRKVSLENSIPYDDLVKATYDFTEVTTLSNSLTANINAQKLLVAAVFQTSVVLDSFSGPLTNIKFESAHRSASSNNTLDLTDDNQLRQKSLKQLNAMHSALLAYEESIIESYIKGIKDIEALVKQTSL